MSNDSSYFASTGGSGIIKYLQANHINISWYTGSIIRWSAIKTGTASLSTGQSGRVLVSGAKVGTGVAIGGAGVGYGLTELSKPVTAFTDPIDSLVGFSGVGSIIIIGIIILVLIIILRGKI